MKDRQQYLEIAMNAAVAAGEILMGHTDDLLKVSTKESLRDIVTNIDKYAEQKVIKIIQEKAPNSKILTEETGLIKGEKEDCYWVVDALDGTVNYVNHIPFFAVSIAYYENNVPVVGAIFNPMANDLYYGAEGIGVFKNQTKLTIKDKVAEDCLFACTFSGKKYSPKSRSAEFKTFEIINDSSRGCLRTGSAAINLAFLSEGRFGGCWGIANKTWDIAAGIVLAKLAGAKIEYKYLDESKTIISYMVAVPSAWDYLYGNVREVFSS